MPCLEASIVTNNFISFLYGKIILSPQLIQIRKIVVTGMRYCRHTFLIVRSICFCFVLCYVSAILLWVGTYVTSILRKVFGKIYKTNLSVRETCFGTSGPA